LNTTLFSLKIHKYQAELVLPSGNQENSNLITQPFNWFSHFLRNLGSSYNGQLGYVQQEFSPLTPVTIDPSDPIKFPLFSYNFQRKSLARVPWPILDPFPLPFPLQNVCISLDLHMCKLCVCHSHVCTGVRLSIKPPRWQPIRGFQLAFTFARVQ